MQRPQSFFTALIFWTVLFLRCGTSTAQTPGDSLLSIWHNLERGDSVRLVALSKYINARLLEPNWDSLPYWNGQILQLAEEKHLPVAKAQYHFYEAYQSYEEYDMYGALPSFQKALNWYEHSKYTPGIINSLNYMGQCHRYSAEFSKSMTYYHKVAHLCREIGDSLRLINVNLNIGAVYKILDDYDMALAAFEEAEAIALAQDRELSIAAALANSASIYRRKKEFEKALELNEKALALRKKYGKDRHIASTLNNIGNIYEDLENYDTALEYHQQALDIRERIGELRGIGSSNKNLGSNYLIKNQPAKALKHCKKSLEIFEQISMVGKQAAACLCTYNAEKQLGNFQNALAYHERFLDLDQKMKDAKELDAIRKMEFAQRLQQDSLMEAENRRKVEFDHQLALAKKEKNRNMAIGGFLLALMTAALFYYRYRFTNAARKEIQKEHDRAEGLLLNILPASVAEELKVHGHAAAKRYEEVTVLFTDFKAFTEIAAQLSAKELVDELNIVFKAFDDIMRKYGLEKIKTIGDAYMAAGGLESSQSPEIVCQAALEMIAFTQKRRKELQAQGRQGFQMRAGIHTGPVIAGVVGSSKFQYDIWGDTVNVASRMESNGEPGFLNVSEHTYRMVASSDQLRMISNKRIPVKGKGELSMYLLTGSKD